jgi:outer membrane protein, multidrug efflux system
VTTMPHRAARLAPLALLALTACASGPNLSVGAAPAPPETFLTATAAPDAADLSVWWAGFSDPALTTLVTLSLRDNLDLAQASARVAQANAERDQARAGFFPSLSANVTQSERTPDGGPTTRLANGALEASWAIDLFGAQRGSSAAARQSLDAARFTRENVAAALAAEVARTYIELRTAQRRLAIAEASLRRQTETLEIVGFRQQAGLASDLDLAQARAQRAATAAGLPALRTAEANGRYRLAVLAGMAPGGIDGYLATSNGDWAAPASPPLGVPTDLLRRRPDVRAAQARLEAAAARIQIARAQLYPSLVLTGSLGDSAASFDALGAAWTRTLAGALTQPIFQAGRLRAGVRVREAQAQESFAAYRAALLDALEDVERARAAQAGAELRIAAAHEQADAATIAAEIARANYSIGLTDIRTLLDAERSLLSARDGLAQAQADQATALIQLCLALGGGWSPAPAK